MIQFVHIFHAECYKISKFYHTINQIIKKKNIKISPLKKSMIRKALFFIDFVVLGKCMDIFVTSLERKEEGERDI